MGVEAVLWFLFAVGLALWVGGAVTGQVMMARAKARKDHRLMVGLTREVSAIEGGKWKGSLVAVSTGSNSQMLIYDTKAMTEATNEEPEDTWTWDDFERIANDISRASAEGFYGTEDPSADINMFQVFARQRGGDLFTGDGKKLGFTKQDAGDWWAYWAGLRDSGAAVPAQTQAQVPIGELAQYPLVRGNAAVTFDYSNRLTAIRELANKELGFNVLPNAAAPGAQFGQPIRPSLLWVIPSRTENPEEVVRVVNELVNNVEVGKVLGVDRGIPASSEVREAVRRQVPEEERQVFAYLELVEERSPDLPNASIILPPAATEVADNWERVSQSIAFGDATIDEAADEFFSQAEQALSS